MAAKQNGHSFRHGWHIGWAWGSEASGLEFVDFLSEHRMTDICADRFFSDGTRSTIETPHMGFLTSSDPEEQAQLEQEFYDRNRRVYADLRERGLLPPAGANLSSQDINEFLRSGHDNTGAN